MNTVTEKFIALLPPVKSTPSKWRSFNCPCCHNRGHSRDTRKRAGVLLETGIIFNCFNCKYSANWEPGRSISEKLKQLCVWLGATNDEINQLIFEAFKSESTDRYTETVEHITFPTKELPDGTLSLAEWISVPLDIIGTDLYNQLLLVVEYAVIRGLDPLNPLLCWSPITDFADRLIIQLRFQHRIVGYTARRITNVIKQYKYMSDHSPHFVFNLDNQDSTNKYVFVTEGPIDALQLNGVALLTNNVVDQQARLINQIGSTIIVIPDQDVAGLVLIKKAIEYNWAVAFPNWEDDIKDVTDAVARYGKLFVTVDSIKSALTTHAAIKIAMHKLEAKLRRLHD